LTFAAQEGGNPISQPLLVTNSGEGTLYWTAAITAITGGDWLALSPSSGIGDSTLIVTANIAFLVAGNYNAIITVTAKGALYSPQNVEVSLTITPKPVFTLLPAVLSFVERSGNDPAPQQLTISSDRRGLPWSAGVATFSGGNWLSVSATSGATPDAITVAVNGAGLGDGTYQGAITISVAGAANSPQTTKVTLMLGTSVIALTTRSLVFVTPVGRNPSPQTFEVRSAGTGTLGWTATVTTQAGGSWLTVSPSMALAPSTVSVAANSAGLARGAYTGTITVAALPNVMASNSPQAVTVDLAVDAPVVGQGGVVNAASLSREAVVSPGSIVSLFGTNLASTTAQVTTLPLPAILADTQTLVNNIPAPLLYVSPNQINLQMPPGLSEPTAQVVVVSGGVPGVPGSITVAPQAPGIFTVTADGTGQGAVLNEDSSLNSAHNPVVAGAVIQIFATGLGATNPPAAWGQPAGTLPLSLTLLTPDVLIGGIPADVLFSGLAPFYVGLNQVNARVPAGAPAGDAVPLQIRIGGRASNTVSIAVR
jgi:uncharacterized protein (TIGR03437 family)